MKRIIAAVLISAVSVFVQAKEFEEGQTWVTSGFWSYHFTKDRAVEVRLVNVATNEVVDSWTEYREFNNENSGVGLEHRVSDTWSLTAGTYLNSYEKDSVYATAVWSKRVHKHVRAGIGMGAVSGYEVEEGKEEILPLVIPTLSVDLGRVGLNIVATPAAENPAVSVQFKIRLR